MSMDRERGDSQAARLASIAGALAAIGLGLSWATAAAADPEQTSASSSAPLIQESRDGCAEIEARLAQRRQWLADRRIEQFARGGAPNPDLGIPDVTWQWCEAHPRDANCNMPRVTVFLTTEELRGGQAPEEYDPHVILMKRALRECRGEEQRKRLQQR